MITDRSQAPCCTSHEMEGCPHTCISQNIHISKYIQLYPGEWWLYKLYKQLILIWMDRSVNNDINSVLIYWLAEWVQLLVCNCGRVCMCVCVCVCVCFGREGAIRMEPIACILKSIKNVTRYSTKGQQNKGHKVGMTAQFTIQPHPAYLFTFKICRVGLYTGLF